MPRKIVIAGGTGFLGTCLVSHFSASDAEVHILTRQDLKDHGNVRYQKWDGKNQGAWSNCLEHADVVINMNGKSVDCRYTEKNKLLIYSTRLDATTALGIAIQNCKIPPRLWINAGSATIYRHSVDREMDEYTGEIGTGFSVDVCQKWEQTFNSFQFHSTRQVILRTGIVFGKNGGPLKPLMTLARIGFGGRHGSGEQYFSWLHENDFVGIIDFIINHPETKGAYNVTSPNPVTNKVVMRAVRKSVGMLIGIPMPVWILEIGACLIRTETELILKSRRVIPKRLLDTGYKFRFDKIEDALRDLCKVGN